MKLHFLCPHHRQWLADNPHHALNTWLQSHDKAAELFEDGDWNNALSHAGCALETAEIALEAWPDPPPRIINRYADNGVLLAQLLRERGDQAATRAVIANCIGRLERLMFATGNHRTVLKACEGLLRIGDATGWPESSLTDATHQSTHLLHQQLH
tara:strand:- start:15238 stop:15702 length:465 start_codon:yes stop_codon:yes gene_type:complete